MPDTKTLLAIAAAAAVVFWPQLSDAIAKLLSKGGGSPVTLPPAVSSSPPPPPRAGLIVKVLELRDAAAAIDPAAASLLGQAAVQLIGGKDEQHAA